MKPILRGYFHQEFFFITLGACIPLILQCKSSDALVSVIIYSFCALVLFGVSALYHRIHWEPEARLWWKKLDHANIYLMIAGTFTPIALLGLSAASAKQLLITIWIVAIVGIVQSLFFVNLPKFISAIIYLVAGYLILPYFSELKLAVGESNSWLIVAGGVAYSIGAICYGLKLCNFNPKYFGYHEVFHIFVILGALLHFIVVSSLVYNL
jgi:hemolysin III